VRSQLNESDVGSDPRVARDLKRKLNLAKKIGDSVEFAVKGENPWPTAFLIEQAKIRSPQIGLVLVAIAFFHTVEPLSTDTSFIRTFSFAPTKSSYTFSKINPLYTDTG